MGCSASKLSEDELEACVQITRGHFTKQRIRTMYSAFVEVAPTGTMEAEQFAKFLEKLAMIGVTSVHEQRHGHVDHDHLAKKLFRGYTMSGQRPLDFRTYLLAQEAVVFSTELLPEMVFAMLDGDGDGVVYPHDLVCLVQGEDTIVDDEYLPLISEQVLALFLFLSGGSDVRHVTAARFKLVMQEHPQMLDKLLALL